MRLCHRLAEVCFYFVVESTNSIANRITYYEQKGCIKDPSECK